MRRSLQFINNVLPTSLSFERLRTPLNLFGIIITAWISAGIVSQALASFISTPASTNKKSAASSLSMNASADYGAISGDYSRAASRYDYNVIVDRNIFDSTNKVSQLNKPKDEGKSFVSRRRTDGPPVPTSLPVKLLGTLVSSNPSLSLATISASGKADSDQYGVGDRLMGEAVITSIERNRVYILRNGAKEYIESDDAKGEKGAAPMFMRDTAPVAALAPAGGIKEVAPGKYNIDKSRIEQVMANLNEVMTQARVVPHFDNGKAAGWKIFAIKPNSIYQELNLQNGDIIQRINGVEVDSPAKALEMYQQLASESHVTIDVVRNGAKQTFDYDIR